jgi:penicillin-binding protein 2
MTQYEVKLRLIVLRVLVVLVFVFLAFETWRLQVTRGQEYSLLADRNRFRVVTLDAPRGVMYDRDGHQIVRNQPTFNVVVIPAFLPDGRTARAHVFARLSEWLEMPITTKRSPGDAMVLRQPGPFLSGWSGAPWDRQSGDGVGGPGASVPMGVGDIVESASLIAPYQPITIKEDVDPTVAALLEEASLDLPGVLVEVVPVRDYLAGDLTAKVIGYTGSIPQARLEEFEASGYAPNERVGLTGLELQYEDLLHSTKGEETIEVDVSGRKVRTVGDPILAQPGHNLKLTLDMDLQQAVADALSEGIRETDQRAGVAIVMDPRSGQILAMVSLPTYDNNLFIGGISVRDYVALSTDKRRPLVDHAISGLYPPGSTYKIIPAAGALQEGVVAPDTLIVAEGTLWVPNKFFPDDPELAQPFYCWYREGHGRVNVTRALAVSCDIYFYQIAGGYEPSGFEGLGEDLLGYYAELFGMGNPTGIDLPGEVAGLVPTPKWKRINYAETWVTGDTYNMGIGQGFVLATPLQILNMMAAVGNMGLLYQPYVVQEILDADGNVVERREPQTVRDLLDTISPETLGLVRSGLEAVTAPGGTGEELYVPGVAVAAKTGTAEFCDSYPACLDKEGRVSTSHAWFTAYAPAHDPEVAVVVLVYGGGEGSITALPIAGEILRYYFDLEPEEEPEEPVPAPPGPPPPGATFVARLLGTDGWGEGGAALTGYVLDRNGMPVPGVAVDIVADLDAPLDDELVARVVSGPTGQFDFNAIDPTRARRWRVELAEYPTTHPLIFDAGPGYRYTVAFQSD